MRCGWRVFTKKNNPPAGKTTVLNCYIGKLPDHNEIGFVSMQNEGQYSVMTLDVLWKAPFRFVLEAQDYANPNGGGGRSYEISNFTSTYIDITFCYATVFTGDLVIPADNPLFSHATLTQNESDCTLRLHFKKAGGFYGWDANYNEKGQLCFKFLNPAKITKSDNAYGVDLSGIKIMLDVGHGGVDGGTVGYTSGGVRYTEAERNLNLSMALKAQLESMGATVLLNRSDNSTRTVDERILMMRGSNLDLLIAVHHNASSSTGASGFESFYYGPISHVVTHQVNNATQAAGIYSSCDVGWHVYYMGRQTYCPVVLTENGYMSNATDMDAIADQGITEQKAQAIAQGVATVTAKTRNSAGHTVSCEVTVVPAPDAINLKESQIKMGAGNSYDLRNSGLIENIPANSSASYTYKTSNAKVVSVSSEGVLTAKKIRKKSSE